MLLRREGLSKDLMIGVMSSPRDLEELEALAFTVPAHQQSFMLGSPF